MDHHLLVGSRRFPLSLPTKNIASLNILCYTMFEPPYCGGAEALSEEKLRVYWSPEIGRNVPIDSRSWLTAVLGFSSPVWVPWYSVMGDEADDVMLKAEQMKNQRALAGNSACTAICCPLPPTCAT